MKHLEENQLFKFDLQLFAQAEDEGRTEEPTPRKKQRARQRGQVAKSVELTSAVIALVSCLLLSAIGYYMFSEMIKFVYKMLSEVSDIKGSLGNAPHFSLFIIYSFLRIVLPIMIITFIVALISEISQVGLRIAPYALRFDITRLKVDLIGRFFNFKKMSIEYGKTLFKIVVITYVTYTAIKKNYPSLLLMMDISLMDGLGIITKITYEILLKVAIFLFLMSLFDYIYQRQTLRQSLMMTKHELRDEWKQMEGDPNLRRRIRERQRQMSSRRMMAEVPKADVVITNPTHIAIAIKYNPAHMPAPIVVAKGKDILAIHIKDVAAENGVAIIENKPLAEALFDAVEIGDQIPPQFYQAVAEILAFVYRLKEGSTATGRSA